jgi:hypothetical protein
MRTWSQWRKTCAAVERLISTEDYDAVGGFEGALNQHADELLESDAVRAEPKFVETVFKRLTAVGHGNRERRDPAPLSELWDLCDAATDEKRQRVNRIIDAFRHGDATFLSPATGS